MPGDSPLYLLHSATESPETGRSNYFTVVDSLGASRTLDYASSLELPGRARLYAEKGVGFFAIADGETPTITRYELTSDGAFEQGPSLSFSAYGIGEMGAQAVLFVSPTKAYYKDYAQAQVIVWDPTAMAVTGSLALPPELLVADQNLVLSRWAKREGDAFFTASWEGLDYDRVLPGLALIRIDTATDEITVTREERCRDVFNVSQVGDTFYFFSDVINAFGYAVHGSEGGQQDCILRLPPGQPTFDPDYVGSIAGALGEGMIGHVASVQSDGTAWIQAVDTALVPTAIGTTYDQFYSAGWSWWSVDLATLATGKRVPGEPGAYVGSVFVADPDVSIPATEADYSQTTLLNVATDPPTSGLSFPGFPLDVVRLR